MARLAASATGWFVVVAWQFVAVSLCRCVDRGRIGGWTPFAPVPVLQKQKRALGNALLWPICGSDAST